MKLSTLHNESLIYTIYTFCHNERICEFSLLSNEQQYFEQWVDSD